MWKQLMLFSIQKAILAINKKERMKRVFLANYFRLFDFGRLDTKTAAIAMITATAEMMTIDVP
jgi:hypothetical protein